MTGRPERAGDLRRLDPSHRAGHQEAHPHGWQEHGDPLIRHDDGAVAHLSMPSADTPENGAERQEWPSPEYLFRFGSWGVCEIETPKVPI